jgi:hypothetical protein
MRGWHVALENLSSSEIVETEIVYDMERHYVRKAL